MSADADAVEVRILDEPFFLVSRSQAEADRLRDLAERLDALLRQLQSASPGLSREETAMLGALEMLKGLDEREDQLNQVQFRLDALQERIRECL